MPKLLASFLSSMLICLIGAYMEYTPSTVRLNELQYATYLELFVQGWLIVLPIFLLLVWPLSVLLQALLVRFFDGWPKAAIWWMYLIGHMAGGAAAGWLFTVTSSQGEWNTNKWPFMLAALMYWAAELLFQSVQRNRKKSVQYPGSLE